MPLSFEHDDTADRAAALERSLAAASPRLSPGPTGALSLAIHACVLLLWLGLLSRAVVSDTLSAWSVGLFYLAYDTLLIAIVSRQTLTLLRDAASPPPAGLQPSLGIIVAAHNEAAVLPITLRALLGQRDRPDRILIADDGSSDATRDALARFGLAEPLVGASSVSAMHPNLIWLRLPHGGKARALNAGLLALDTDVVVTVDGDTLLDLRAVGTLRAAFAAEPPLFAAAGVLMPVCGTSASGRLYEYFQRREYIRNALAWFAWARLDALVLIPGAFAGFRRDALLAVGGFDPACLVEDYELIHRLRRHGAREGLGWTARVVGARAVTDAPATTAAFLGQRRRWFCGFLQTQFWYRDMVGNARYGRVGTLMLPLKAIDTLQPIFGLTAFVLLPVFLAAGRWALLESIGLVWLAKIAVDFAYHLWSTHVFRRWVDPEARMRLDRAIPAAFLEPFTFQIMRHLGAALGWVDLLTGHRAWGRQKRLGLVAPTVETADPVYPPRVAEAWGSEGSG